MERMFILVPKTDKHGIRQAAARLNKNMSDYIRWLHAQHLSEYPLPPAIPEHVLVDVDGSER